MYIIVFFSIEVRHVYLYNGDVNDAYVIDCLGSMIMGSNQHYRRVSEVKWNTVVVGRTNPIKRGQILTPPIFSDLVLWTLSLKPNVGT